MAYKILEAIGVENENVDGAGFNNFLTASKNCILKDILDECAMSVVGNTLIIAKGEIIIQGVRIKLTESETYTLSSIPAQNTEYQIVAQIQLDLTKNVYFSLFVRPTSVLTQQNLYDDEQGIYQVELGTFTHTTSGSIENLTRTLAISYATPETVGEAVDGLMTQTTNGIKKLYLSYQGEAVGAGVDLPDPDSGEQGVGIEKIESGTPTQSGEYTVTPITVTKTDGNKESFNVSAKQGIQGLKGDKGDTGAQGLQGIQGEIGPQGIQGIQGEKGEKGDKGEQGIQGEKGEKGVSVHSIAAGESFQSADGAKTYTPIRVRLDDNVTEAVFNVEAVNGAGQKGEKGDKGDKGDQGISVTDIQAGDSFEQDGYTVTPINVILSNNEGKIFYVEAKNGANGSGSGSVVLPDNVAEYDGATSSGEIIVSDETSNKIKTSAIKIAKSRVTTANTGETTGDGMWGSNVRSTDEEMPTSRAVCEALRGTFDYFVAIGETQADRTEIAENEVVIGDPSFLMKAAVRGSQKFLTNDYDFRQEGKPIDDTHIPTTKVVKTIVNDALLDSDGVSVVSQVNGITSGTKRLKKVLIGNTENAGSIAYETKEDNTESLILSAEHDIGLRVNEQSGVEIVDRDIDIYVPEEDASIISIRGGDVNIKGGWADGSAGGVSISGAGSSSFSIGKSGGKEMATLFANDLIKLKATNDSGNGELVLSADNINVNGNVDFSNATVTGLPNNSGSSGSSGGTLSIEVNELPTENIDSSRIYLLSTAENAEVYYLFEVGYFTLKDLVTIQMGIQPEINYYVVKELPTSPLTSDLATFSSINCYIYNDIAYVYGNAGAGNMWLTVSTLISQISGTTVIDKGRTPNIATENNGFGMYVYYEEVKKLCIYSNQEWVEVSNSKSNKYILNLFGESGTLTDEQYQALKDNFSNVTVLCCHEDGIFALPITVITQGYFSGSFVIGFTEYTITISPAKVWVVEQNNFKKGVVTTTGVEQTIESEKIFNSTVTFNAAVDFTNANVTGLTGIKAKKKINLPTLQSFCKSTYGSYEGGLVSMYCKNAEVITPELNEVVSTVLRIGCSPLSNGAYEVYNKVTHNALSDDGTTLYIYEYLLRIGYDIVVLDKTTTAINLADGTSTKTTESFGHKVIDVYFDFYFYN